MAGQVTQPKRQQPHLLEQQPRARWTTSLTKVLAGLMVEQVQRGNRRNNSFGKKAWSYMCDEFHTKTESPGCRIYKIKWQPNLQRALRNICRTLVEWKLDQSNENSMGTHFSNSCAKQLSMNEEDSSSSDSDDYDQETTQPATPSVAGSRKRGRKWVDEAIAGAILAMAAASRLRTAAVQQRQPRNTISD